jgi:hypothetical protein
VDTAQTTTVSAKSSVKCQEQLRTIKKEEQKMETYAETCWILTAYNEERRVCFGTEQEVDQYLNLLNSTREINHWQAEAVEVLSQEQDGLAFSIFEALRENEDFDA